MAGTAGTDKTILAPQRALSFAQQGRSCLFVCFNAELASWLREKVESDPAHSDYAQRLHIWHFHALAKHIANRASIEFRVPNDSAEATRFWDEEVADILEQAATILKNTDDFQYSAIVVDEAQDFCELWWYALTESFLENPTTDPLYVFLDVNQTLRNSAAPLPIDIEVRYQLKRNCRNVQKIAKTCAKLRQLDSLVLSSLPVGKAPIVIKAELQRQQEKVVLHHLQQLISQKRLSPERIVLLGPKRKENGSLAKADKCADVSLITKAKAWRQSEGALVTTARNFKGLEADVVIIYYGTDQKPGFLLYKSKRMPSLTASRQALALGKKTD